MKSRRLAGGWDRAGKSKQSVLAELGRLIWSDRNGEPIAVRLAAELAGMRPKLTTKRAAAWVRRVRLASPSPGSAEKLAEAIMSAIDGYLATHPDTPVDEIEEAVGIVGGIWSQDDHDE